MGFRFKELEVRLGVILKGKDSYAETGQRVRGFSQERCTTEHDHSFIYTLSHSSISPQSPLHLYSTLNERRWHGRKRHWESQPRAQWAAQQQTTQQAGIGAGTDEDSGAKSASSGQHSGGCGR